MRSRSWRVGGAFVFVSLALVLTQTAVGAASTAPGGAARELPLARAINPSPQQIQRDVFARASVGLRSDEDYVRDLLVHPDRYVALDTTSLGMSLFGLSLTADEVAAFSARNELVEPVNEINRSSQKVYPDTFGGAYLANTDDGRGAIVVQLTRDPSAEQRAATLTAVTPDDSSRVQFEVVKNTQQELIDAARRIMEIRDAAITEPHAGQYVDLQNNRVVVDGKRMDGAAIETAARGVTVAYDDAAEYAIQPLGLYKTQALSFGLVEGGQGIVDTVHYNPATTSYSCSSAFAAHGAFGWFILTAAHCSSYMDNVMFDQGGSHMGNMAAHDSSLDVGAIATYGYRNQAGRMHENWSDYYHAVNYLTTGDSVGIPMCQTGTTSTQGGLNASPCGTVTSVNYVDSGRTDCRTANFVAAAGDSGASVYDDTIFGRAAQGILDACKISGGQCVLNPPVTLYSYLPTTMSMWGLTLDNP